MKVAAQEQIVSMFAQVNCLQPKHIAIKVKCVIAHTAAPFNLFFECLDPSGLSKSPNPIDGLLITLARRMYDVVSGTLSLFSQGRLQQAEILSRTVMESALSLRYIVEADSATRLMQFFEHYVAQEREQNRKWLKELASLPESWRADHEARITNKNDALDNITEFLRVFAKHIGVAFPTKKGYPNLLGICMALGKVIDYRTVYTAMCSQAHHDAEDILNDLIVGSSPNESKLSPQLEIETNNFSTFLVLHGIRYYLECMSSLGAGYKFRSVTEQCAKSHGVISDLLLEVSSGGFITNETEGWLPNIIQ